MATRTRSKRTPANVQRTPTNVQLGPATTENVTRGAITRRGISAYTHDGRPSWIGWLIHRDYDSGYPAPWEVLKGGGQPWGFYATEADALAGASAYASAFVAASRRHGFVDLNDLHGPAKGFYDPRPGSGAETSTAALTAAHIRHLLDQHPVDDVHGLRRALDEYAGALANTPSPIC